MPYFMFSSFSLSVKNKSILYLGLCISVLLFLFSCESDTPKPGFEPPDSSFGLIYTNIFSTSCALSGCHDGSSRSPSLTGEGTYDALIGQKPENQMALQAGLQLIKPSDPDSSFLYQKLVFDVTEFKFGSPMPQGGISLSSEKIEFVKLWIEAGAPETGHVADRSLIE